jgi:riboflavin synthase alpha subunit
LIQGKVIEKWKENDSLWIKVQVEESFLKYIVPKGFIAVDGTSLTICDVGPSWFTFMLVPHTQNNVIIPSKNINDEVNIEVDVVAKMIEKSLNIYAEHILSNNQVFQTLKNDYLELANELKTLKKKLNINS